MKFHAKMEIAGAKVVVTVYDSILIINDPSFGSDVLPFAMPEASDFEGHIPNHPRIGLIT